jgi:hypothetical protein
LLAVILIKLKEKRYAHLNRIQPRRGRLTQTSGPAGVHGPSAEKHWPTLSRHNIKKLKHEKKNDFVYYSAINHCSLTINVTKLWHINISLKPSIRL